MLASSNNSSSRAVESVRQSALGDIIVLSNRKADFDKFGGARNATLLETLIFKCAGVAVASIIYPHLVFGVRRQPGDAEKSQANQAGIQSEAKASCPECGAPVRLGLSSCPCPECRDTLYLARHGADQEICPGSGLAYKVAAVEKSQPDQAEIESEAKP
jgi:hypothetical protein